ncbi:Nuclear rim protein 1 [Allomyces arbusculus]|nr:Nuclear rim protein 1 [Allomyces arbusculus]
MSGRASRLSASGRSNVRRKSLWHKATTYPGDLYLKWMEEYELMDWQWLHSKVSYLLGLALNGIYLFTRLVDYAAEGGTPPAVMDPRFARLSLPGTGSAAAALAGVQEDWSQWAVRYVGLDQWTAPIQTVLWIVSITNALSFFMRGRRYQLLEVDPDNLPKSWNIRKVPIDAQTPSWALSFPGNVLWRVVGQFWLKIKANESSRMVWELNAWEISKFHQIIFCAFSPVQLMILHFVDMSLMFVPLLAAVSGMLFFVTKQYTDLLHDKQLIFTHMYREYHVRLINPRLFVARTNAECETDVQTDFPATVDEEGEEIEEDELLPSADETFIADTAVLHTSAWTDRGVVKDATPRPPPAAIVGMGGGSSPPPALRHRPVNPFQNARGRK